MAEHARPRERGERRLQLRDSRLSRGWSQRDLATRIGVDVQTVARWEAGKTTPQARHFSALCDALQLTGEELSAVIGGLGLASIVPIRQTEASVALAVSNQTETQQEFFKSVLSALARGDATSAEWQMAAEATARSLGIPWRITS